LTFAVAIPSFMTAFTVAASLEYAGVRQGGKGLFGWMWRLPWFDADRPLFAYSIAGLLIFIYGGLTGIVNASYNINQTIHNTGFILGHFHMTVGGPVFLMILGMSLELIRQLTGKPIRLKGWNVAVPYLWILGLVVFSTAMMYGGLLGQPRRTNMGLSYLDPSSPHFRADWVPTAYLTGIGGTILTVAFVIYLAVLLSTLLGKAEAPAGQLSFPTAESLHPEAKETELISSVASLAGGSRDFDCCLLLGASQASAKHPPRSSPLQSRQSRTSGQGQKLTSCAGPQRSSMGLWGAPLSS
jgi:cytochrome c oxidase subunit 1